MRRRILAAAVSCGIAVAALPAEHSPLVGVPQAIAHDVVIDSTPKDNAELSTFPEQIELHFSGVIQDGFNTIAITDTSSGEVLYTTEPELDGQFVRVEIPEENRRDAGDFMVGFQITSSDGHATRGSTKFKVGNSSNGDVASPAASSSTQTHMETSTTREKESRTPTAYYVLAGLALLLIISFIAVVLRKLSTHKSGS